MITTVSIPAVFLTNILGVQLTADKVAMISCMAKLLFYLQPIINPIIYIVRRPEYRINHKKSQYPRYRYRCRQSRGKFYSTARAFVNSKRFTDLILIQMAQKETLNAKGPFKDIDI